MRFMPVSQRVVHEKYGLGIITATDRRYTTVEFDLYGKKKFITRIVSLAPSDEPPPRKRRASSRNIRPA